MLDAEKINDLRRRVLNNEPWDETELAEAIRQAIGTRMDELTNPKDKGKKAKEPKAPVKTVDLSKFLPGKKE